MRRCWRYEDEAPPARLARGTAATGRGAERAGLETAGDRRRTRGDRRRGQPVAEAGTGGGRRGVAAPSCAGTAAQAERRATRPDSGLAHPWSGGVRVPRPGVDLQARDRGDPAHVGRHVPSGPRQPAAACAAAQRPAAGHAGHPTRRGRDCRLVARPLAGLGKKAVDEGRTIVWVDQSGFYLLPMAVRTWAPCGRTPVLRVPLTHDHLAAIGGLTPDGRLFLQTQDHAYHSPDVVRFLRVLLRKIAGKLLVIWDGAPIHRGQPIKDYLARGAAKRIHLEQLPGYAPDLNPVEGIWAYLKCRELGNICCKDFPELELALRRAKERLRHKRHVLQGCIAECGYPV